MMTTQLIRESLRPLYEAAQDSHSGLLLQRGLAKYDQTAETNDQTAKTKHIDRVCKNTAGDFYKRAYKRWEQGTLDANRFRHMFLKLNTRLFIGLTGGGMLETGCAISHSYGMPYIPGSSVKGVVNAYARDRLSKGGADICDELFGAPATEERPEGLSGLISFHDAWWVPDSASYPLVQEVVTSHHLDYYGRDGATPATDFDSPVPNAQVAVQGDFLFVLEGPLAWLELAEQILIDALSTQGAGAKTRAGYGVFSEDAERRTQREEAARQAQEEAARLKKEEEERREQQRRAGLPKGRRRIEDVQHQVERFKAAEGHGERRGTREQVKTAANRLTEGDFEWTDAAEREKAATALEECYDKIGWYDPGKNRKQRTRQETRRREDIAKIRNEDS